MKLHKRRKARALLVQALYQEQINPKSLVEVRGEFLSEINPNKVDVEFFTVTLEGVLGKMIEIDQGFEKFLDRTKDSLSRVELAILRLGTYELLFVRNLPYKVAINEALELAKKFGSVASYKYVNGILDKVAKSVQE